MSQDPARKQPQTPPEATATGVESTAPGPKDDPRQPTDNQRGWTQASPAGQIGEADNPDDDEARHALARAADRSVPVIEPAHDQTGIQVIDPSLVYTGYWGPLDESRHPAILALRAAFPDVVEEVVFFRDEVTVRVPLARFADVIAFLRSDQSLSYQMLSDLTAVDMLHLRAQPRFDVVATIYSVVNRVRLRVKTGVAEGQPCPTLTGVHKTAGWLERECNDMFGIVFEGHPDLRRMLLSDDWDEGHPLRKDYPIRGFKQYVQPGFESPAPRVTDFRKDY